MKISQRIAVLISVMLLGAILPSCNKEPAVIYLAKDSDATEKLAAREIRKYIYLRTGELLSISTCTETEQINRNAILVGSAAIPRMKSAPPAGPDDFILKTIDSDDTKSLMVLGGSSTGTLYAAYELAEQLGIGFFLDGDIVPDTRTEFVFPELDIKQSPLFTRRGIQPFHDFPEGPDWWNKEDYKAVLSQLPKMKMNFFGMHTYPEGGVGPEPLVWIGLPEDVNPDGTVKTAYHSRHFTTVNGTWGYKATRTSDYSFGAGQLFSHDDFGPDYMKNRTPWPDPSDEINLFNEMGSFLNDVLSYANKMGVKTCLGTEIPLVLPEQFTRQLKEKGMDPESPAVRQKIYEGIFTRIKNTHPADFYWFWTPEGWTWSGNKQEDIDKTIRDFDAAIKALNTVNPGFSLATCGWVLGPAGNRALFDKYLPDNIAFSCINRNLGWEPVDTAFAKIEGREKWAIPWMEDDPGLSIPQLWAGRMRRDAADAYAYGCNGYFGIHWRTRILSANVSSLAKAAWDQSWNPEKGKRIPAEEVRNYLARMENGEARVRDMECLDFYRNWCRVQFGPEISEAMANIFTSIDGVRFTTTELNAGISKLPRPATWINGPGNMLPDVHPWDSVKVQYAFIDEIEKLRPSVKGKGNQERFDYWLNQFRYLRSFGKLSCTAGEFNREFKKIKSLDENQKKDIVKSKLIPLIVEEAGELKDIHFYLISSISTWGGIGNVANWQQHIIPSQINAQVESIKSLSADTTWIAGLYEKDMKDLSRIIVPSPRTMIEKGKDYTVKVICFNVEPEKAVICWGPLGSKDFKEIDLQKTGGTFWQATIPAGSITEDFEYHIRIEQKNKEDLWYPGTAPRVNNAVVIID